MMPKSQNYFEYRIMFFEVCILEIKTNFHVISSQNGLYTLVKKLKIAKKLHWKKWFAYSHGNIYWCPKGHMRKSDNFRKPLLVIVNLSGIKYNTLWFTKGQIFYLNDNLHEWSDHIQFCSAQILVFSLKQTFTINDFNLEAAIRAERLFLSTKKINPSKMHLEKNEGEKITHKQLKLATSCFHFLWFRYSILLEYFPLVSDRFNQQGTFRGHSLAKCPLVVVL